MSIEQENSMDRNTVREWLEVVRLDYRHFRVLLDCLEAISDEWERGPYRQRRRYPYSLIFRGIEEMRSSLILYEGAIKYGSMVAVPKVWRSYSRWLARNIP
jgi:hypothetical protein